MYVAVKGGEAAIDAAHELLAKRRRGDPSVPELSIDQIREQMSLAVDRVMTEGGLYDLNLAALAIKQARGDMVEAIFLLRAYRTTLPRLIDAEPIETGGMRIERRISAVFKDIPGGQQLGPTFDYTHRLLDFALAGESEPAADRPLPPTPGDTKPRVTDVLGHEGLIEAATKAEDGVQPGDITRTPPTFPTPRDVRLQTLARGDEGFLLGMGYSTQRGFGHSHPFVAEIRKGHVAVEVAPPELGFAVEIGEIELTECEMVNQFKGSETTPPQFTSGYGLAFGGSERKAMSMALVDRSLRAAELGEEVTAPAQDQEFVLSHADNLDASGFVQHLKLPHYVDFQSELELLRRIRADWTAEREAAE
ncbi:MAG TPA: carbon-phosphorus lyase complex subunit PhnI [Rhizobiaceae bacterium]|nr:carbon-phosphorus lyase complex subunit PhnI [Rhizobiaceae bacterium]